MIDTQEELTLNEIEQVGEAVALYKPYCQAQQSFHSSLSQFRWLFGGNQSGKSYACMMDLALIALELHPYREPVSGGIHWVGIESWEQARDALWTQYLEVFIPKWQIADIWWGQDHTPRKVFLRNGHTIEFKAFNQGRTLFQARQIDTFHGDEQCLHDFQGIFNEIQARLMARNGYMAWSMTPIIPQLYLEERLEKCLGIDDIFYLDLNDNRRSRGGCISDDRVDQMISEWPDEVHASRVQGRFSTYYGAVYKSFNRSIHVINPFDIPEDWPRYRGFDFGFTNPFVCLWLTKDKDDSWYLYREYYKSRTGIQEHIGNVLALSGKEKYEVSFADPEDAGNRSEMRGAGITTLAARKDVARGIELVQSKLKMKENEKPSLFIFNTCKNTCREFMLYQYPRESTASNPRDLPLSKNDHTLDALRYVIYSVDSPRKKVRIIYAG